MPELDVEEAGCNRNPPLGTLLYQIVSQIPEDPGLGSANPAALHQIDNCQQHHGTDDGNDEAGNIEALD